MASRPTPLREALTHAGAAGFLPRSRSTAGERRLITDAPVSLALHVARLRFAFEPALGERASSSETPFCERYDRICQITSLNQPC
jgi:hypothetical protein